MPDVPQAVLDKLNAAARRVLRVRSNALRSEIYGVLEEARVGRGPNMGPRNQRSAPGDPPARQTGRLMESVKVVSLDEANLTALIGPDPQAFTETGYYPPHLEFGTVHIEPRPFMRPALERFKAAIGSGTGRPPP